MPSPFTADRRRGQAAQRRFQRFTDQHGRKWGATTEIQTGHPTGSVAPLFLAPLIPEPKYYRFGVDEDNPAAMRIDYDLWVTEKEQAEEDYERKLMEIGFHLHGDAFDPTKPMSKALRLHLGRPPFPAEVVRQTRDGDPWMLGATPAVPEWVKPYLHYLLPPKAIHALDGASPRSKKAVAVGA